MRSIRFVLTIACLCLIVTASAETEIHKCTDADGNVAYSQLPCVDQKPADPEQAEQEAAAPDETDIESLESEWLVVSSPQPTVEEANPKSDAELAACKKHFRDEIDAIDAEIGREYSPEKADDYKQQLLALTRQLRQC